MNYFLVLKKYFILLMMLGSVNLFANDNGKFLIFGHTGFTKDFAPPYFSSYWERGLNMGLGLGLRLSENVVLQGSAEYHLFKKTKDVITNGDGSVYSLLLNLKKSAPGKTKSSFMPYYKAGAGLLQLNTVAVFSSTGNEYSRESAIKLEEGEKHRSVFSAAAGMGIDTIINDDTMLFMEVSVVLGFDRNEIITIVPLKLGVSVEL